MKIIQGYFVADKMIRGQFNLGDGNKAFLVLGSGIENALGVMSDRNLYRLPLPL
jgi:lipoprotein-releasing system permease protein